MEKFARTIIGYHGCRKSFADHVLLRKIPIGDWHKSQNEYDWLGEGIYFWEHSPKRALRWAEEKFKGEAGVLGAVIQLGACFDLLDEDIAALLGESFDAFKASFEAAGQPLPVSRGKEKKLRDLDCAVINDCIDQLAAQGADLRHSSWGLSRRRAGFRGNDDFIRNAYSDCGSECRLHPRRVLAKLVGRDRDMEKQPTIAEMRRAIEASTRSMTPLEHFRRMVASGLINARGEVTKLIGGDAEPEPGARRPSASVSKNGD
jgi:hypothetical protein